MFFTDKLIETLNVTSTKDNQYCRNSINDLKVLMGDIDKGLENQIPFNVADKEILSTARSHYNNTKQWLTRMEEKYQINSTRKPNSLWLSLKFNILNLFKGERR